MRRITTRRIVIAGATAGAVLLTGGVAFAFWSSTGTAAGAAEVAAAAADLTVEQSGVDPTNQFPDGPPQDVTVTVTNSSSTDIELTDVIVTVDDVVEAAAAVGVCEADDFEILDNGLYSGEVLQSGGDTTTFVAATIQLTETGVNQDACKDADLVLGLTAD